MATIQGVPQYLGIEIHTVQGDDSNRNLGGLDFNATELINIKGGKANNDPEFSKKLTIEVERIANKYNIYNHDQAPACGNFGYQGEAPGCDSDPDAWGAKPNERLGTALRLIFGKSEYSGKTYPEAQKELIDLLISEGVVSKELLDADTDRDGKISVSESDAMVNGKGDSVNVDGSTKPNDKGDSVNVDGSTKPNKADREKYDSKPIEGDTDGDRKISVRESAAMVAAKQGGMVEGDDSEDAESGPVNWATKDYGNKTDRGGNGNTSRTNNTMSYKSPEEIMLQEHLDFLDGQIAQRTEQTMSQGRVKSLHQQIAQRTKQLENFDSDPVNKTSERQQYTPRAKNN